LKSNTRVIQEQPRHPQSIMRISTMINMHRNYVHIMISACHD